MHRENVKKVALGNMEKWKNKKLNKEGVDIVNLVRVLHTPPYLSRKKRPDWQYCYKDFSKKIQELMCELFLRCHGVTSLNKLFLFSKLPLSRCHFSNHNAVPTQHNY